MDYYIVAVNNNKELLGSANQTIVREAKSQVKVNNALKSFNPDKEYDSIRVYSFTNFYDEKTFNLQRVVKPLNPIIL